MTRKYTIGLTTNANGTKEMYIETDDLTEIGSVRWIREYIQGTSASAPAQSDVNVTALIGENEQLRTMVSKMRQQMQQAQARPAQQEQPAPQPQSPRLDGQVQAMAQARPPATPSGAARRLPSSFLEIDPQTMDANMWNSLNEDQRVAWMKQWNIQ